MSQPPDEHQATPADELARLLADAAVWDPVPDDEQDRLLAATGIIEHENRTDELALRRRRWPVAVGAFVAGAAAALLFLVGIDLTSDDERLPDLELELAGSQLAPEARAVAEITNTPDGTVVVLEVDGLEPAPTGSYYEAWLGAGADNAVSAGTFHLRGGGRRIGLWAGVGFDDYPALAITLQAEGEGNAPSDQVMMVGRIERANP